MLRLDWVNFRQSKMVKKALKRLVSPDGCRQLAVEQLLHLFIN